MAKKYDPAELARLYREGLSARVMAKRYGVSKSTVLNWLDKEGIKKRQRMLVSKHDGKKRKYTPPNPTWEAEPVVEHTPGMNILDLQKRYKFRLGEKVRVSAEVYVFEKNGPTTRKQLRPGTVVDVAPTVITVLLDAGYRTSVSLQGLHCGAEALERR